MNIKIEVMNRQHITIQSGFRINLSPQDAKDIIECLRLALYNWPNDGWVDIVNIPPHMQSYFVYGPTRSGGGWPYQQTSPAPAPKQPDPDNRSADQILDDINKLIDGDINKGWK